MNRLRKNDRCRHTGPLVLVVMDGFGIGGENEGNALHLARTPTLDTLNARCMKTALRAHGTAVGLPSDDDMGNSEVGHNALGAGRIFDQGAKLVTAAIDSGRIFPPTRGSASSSGRRKGPPRSISSVSSPTGTCIRHIDHLLRLITRASEEGIRRARIHILLDGRDVPETSALVYVDRLEKHLASFTGRGFDYRIASGGGRMVTTMDRYEADWDIVKRGWEAHVLGKARPFASAREAIETFRREDPEDLTDQYLPAFTVCDAGGPVGPIVDGDSVVFFNFRGDRAIEISRAFEEKDFSRFDRGRFPMSSTPA